MGAPDPIRGTFWAGEAPAPAVLRLVADDGVALKLIDPVYGINSIDLKLYCQDDASETALYSTNLSGGELSGKVFQTLQTDDYKFDDVGYNVLLLWTTEFDECVGGRDYVLDIKVTPTAKPVQKQQVWLRCVGASA